MKNMRNNPILSSKPVALKATAFMSALFVCFLLVVPSFESPNLACVAINGQHVTNVELSKQCSTPKSEVSWIAWVMNKTTSLVNPKVGE